ncbi:MAG: hypothetical protein V4549_02625 [Bacteroidota bacterium]
MKRLLQINFRNVINQAVIEAWRRVPSGPHEPDFIASLVLSGTPGFHNAIIATSGIWSKVNTVGVFCHQSPMVKYMDGVTERRCELGDVLWCHFHTNKEGDTFRNAILFQSKMSATLTPAIHYNDTQLKLYREWPQYEYCRSGSLNGQVRNLLPKQPHAGAQYMFIDNSPITNPSLGVQNLNPYTTFPIGTTTISPLLLGNTPLELELVRFLFLGSGRSFDSYRNRNASDEWTKIIWDLLRNGMSRAFNRRRAGFNNSPRISRYKSSMDGMLTFTGSSDDISSGLDGEFYNEYKDLFSSDDGGNKENNYTPEDKEGGGAPSIIIFRTNESKG